MSPLKERCDFCVGAGYAWCPHNGVLLMYIDGVPMLIRARTEQAARLAADRVRIQWKGAPFHRRQECVASMTAKSANA